jgi:hypothetical protein
LNFKNYKAEYSLAAVLIATAFVLFSLNIPDALDTRLFYTAEESMFYLQSLELEKATRYLVHEIIDLLLFLTCYSALSYLIMKRLYPNVKYLPMLALVPGFFDTIETSSIILYLMKNLSEFPSWMGYVTCLKWTSGLLIATAMGASSCLRMRRIQD